MGGEIGTRPLTRMRPNTTHIATDMFLKGLISRATAIWSFELEIQSLEPQLLLGQVPTTSMSEFAGQDTLTPGISMSKGFLRFVTGPLNDFNMNRVPIEGYMTARNQVP